MPSTMFMIHSVACCKVPSPSFWIVKETSRQSFPIDLFVKETYCVGKILRKYSRTSE